MFDITCLDKNGEIISRFTQWDKNQTISMEIDYNWTEAPEIHFCNKNSDEATAVKSILNGNKITATVPDSLLEEPLPITIYVYEIDQTTGKISGRSLASITLPVIQRVKASEEITVVTPAEPVNVTIGYMELACSSFQAFSETNLYEQPTVSGDNLITNRAKSSTRLVFKGRVHNENQPLRFLGIANTMSNPTGYTIEYRGMLFKNCVIYGFTFDNNGSDDSDVTVTVVTPDIITIKN